MANRQDGGFQPPPPVNRRHYSTGSSQIPTELLQSLNPYPAMNYSMELPSNQFYTNFSFQTPVQIPEPRPRSMSSSRLPPKKPRINHRKMSMNESRPMAMSPSEHSELYAGSWGSVPSLIPGSFESEFSPTTPAQPLLNFNEDTFKKQRRRECHNQVEKRRREHINARIEELSLLLPPHFKNVEDAIDDEEEEEDKKKKTKRSGSKSKDSTHCKGTILSNSVQYIQELQLNNANLYTRIAQLEASMSSGMTWPTFPLQQMERSPEPDLNNSVQFNAAGWNGYVNMPLGRTESLPSTDSKGSGSSPLDQDSPYEEEMRKMQLRKESDADVTMGMHGLEFNTHDMRW